MFKKLKDSMLGKKVLYSTQITSFHYFQLELEYCYKKMGNIDNMVVKDNVKLVDEPSNEYDPKALAVYVLNLKIGYVPAIDTDMVRGFKHKEKPHVRLYYFNGKYRAELNLIHRFNK